MRSVIWTLVIVGWGAAAVANVPSAYLACEGKSDGDSCRYFGGLYGACIQDALCMLEPDENGADRCIVCKDPCHDMETGAACVMDDGESPGVCRIQPQCEDEPETAFHECRYCFPPGLDPDDEEAGEGSCAMTGAAVPWGLILVWGVSQWVRPRRRRSHR